MVALLSPGATYGRIVNRRAVGGFTLKEVVYLPDLKVPPHAHQQATLYVVLHGAYTEVYRSKTLTPKPFGLAFHPSNEVHWHYCPDVGGRCFVIEVEPRWMERVREYTRALEEPTDLQGGMPACLAMRLYREFKQEDGAAPLAIEGLAVETLAEASRRPVRILERRSPRWLDRVKEILRAQFTENHSLDALATAVGVHPTHLARAFRQHYHCTLGDYLRRLRIDFACHQLAHSDSPLIEIALAAGFSDQSHFSKTFKRLVGITPAVFKKHCL